MDDKLKQRLIGALVLVVAAVVFLPMLLSGQDETVSVEVQAPQQPEMSSQPIAPAAPIELPEPEPVAGIPETEVIPMLVEEGLSEAPAVVTPPEPATATPAPEPTPAPTAGQGDWVIQLGSFSAAANADGFKEKLVEQGYNAYTVAATADGKAITRVYVGPVLDRASANRLRDELERRQGAKGFVVAFDAASGKR
ncbi:SPOR domain-containing protein [Halopseudomonas pelagia]|uniref:SPOR domain-containing protein n=1 Tax=Halopseudomonas pelagia TaxID=553151 RepID=UPI0003A037FA|nr:SPOR domain-containing protein [Halopseudomonas pelagia]|tara:strand:+ start:835 stop:1419 length:585 start_codon:yes stop_codon:yes gene_type:complete